MSAKQVNRGCLEMTGKHPGRLSILLAGVISAQLAWLELRVPSFLGCILTRFWAVRLSRAGWFGPISTERISSGKYLFEGLGKEPLIALGLLLVRRGSEGIMGKNSASQVAIGPTQRHLEIDLGHAVPTGFKRLLAASVKPKCLVLLLLANQLVLPSDGLEARHGSRGAILVESSLAARTARDVAGQEFRCFLDLCGPLIALVGCHNLLTYRQIPLVEIKDGG